jgi:hypothetical protein
METPGQGSCFEACGTPRNTSSPCWIRCFYDTVLGQGSNQTDVSSMGLGMTIDALDQGWDRYALPPSTQLPPAFCRCRSHISLAGRCVLGRCGGVGRRAQAVPVLGPLFGRLRRHLGRWPLSGSGSHPAVAGAAGRLQRQVHDQGQLRRRPRLQLVHQRRRAVGV